MNDNISILLGRLDKFIRKYYKNQLIKGALYAGGSLIALFLAINIPEYFGHFNNTVRTLLFYLYIAVNAWVLYRYILIPLMKLLRMGESLTYEQAAKIVGEHFPEIRDKLLNTLQLYKLSEQATDNIDLLRAGIDQKIVMLSPFRFSMAIDFKKNLKYLKFTLVPLLVLMILLLSSPALITEPAYRILKHNYAFEKEVPFRIKIQNSKLEAIQNENFELRVELQGKAIPASLQIIAGNITASLRRVSAVEFSYLFTNVQKDTEFRLSTDDFISGSYLLKVHPRPVMLDFMAAIDYPAYTGRMDESVYNVTDHSVPEGTVIRWQFNALNTTGINISGSKDHTLAEPSGKNRFIYTQRYLSSETFSVSASNNYLKNRDSLSFMVSVIPDAYPSIYAEEFRDSVLNTRLFFKGYIKDDYGFRLLTFNFQKTDQSGSEGKVRRDTIPISLANYNQNYYYYFDLQTLDASPGDEISYYFEVWDNDQVNGSKSARSDKMVFRVPTLHEVENQTEQSNEAIKEKMEDMIRETQRLQNEMEKLNRQLKDKKSLSWDDKKQIEDLLQQQKDLMKEYDETRQLNEDKAKNEEQYKKVNEEIMEKQEQLEKLFEELTKDETLKELFKELEELLKNVDKNKLDDALEQMKMSAEDIEKALDRNLELFKQLEFEKKLDETIDKLDKLAEKQDQLAEESKENKKDSEKLAEKQDQLNKEFEDIRKDLDDLENQNKELEDQNDFDPMDQQQQEVSDEMNQSKNSLQSKQNNKASKSQKSASQKMKEMSESLSSMQMEMLEEGMGEDINSLRQIIENLVKVSFDQEELMMSSKNISPNDPKYNGIIQEQKKVRDDLDMIEDSLIALSKRQIAIETFISKELSSINQNAEYAMQNLLDRRTDIAAGKQQYIMTSVNNIALMLSETLEQMKDAQQQQKSGTGACKSNKPKPGAGQSSMKSIKQLQEQLNQQINQLKEGMKPGEKPGGKKGMSEQLAKMAAQQQAIRSKLGEYSDQMEKQGQYNNKELQQIMQQMEQTEMDLVNKLISTQTLQRQQDIVTRLLKSEKAEMMREQEERRESDEAKNYELSNPKNFLEYKRLKSGELELLKTIPPELKPFYKSKVNDYFSNFKD